MVTRRRFLKATAATGAGMMLSWDGFRNVFVAHANGPALMDPATQTKFVNPVPDALAPNFKILTPNSNDRKLTVFVGQVAHKTGLVQGSTELETPVWGYAKKGGTPSWPGPTFEARSRRKVKVQWQNQLGNSHLLPVDTSLHWAYSLPGYTDYTIEDDGVPIVTHLHGGHTDYPFDGNPEFFFSPDFAIKGPRFVDKTYVYDNDQPAGNLWYHDHALGITRLNVYAGLAGFYFVRDNIDTGDEKNKLGLPAWPYEKAYAIQDRMFYENGHLFYPAFPGDPFYDDFITEELPDPPFGGGGPTALAEFFGDHMVVNGKIWPKEEVEPRHYRLHLLNGTDSRFMAIRFRVAGAASNDPKTIPSSAAVLPFWVIGSDQGLASEATFIQPVASNPDTGYLLCEPGSRYDIVIDFSGVNEQRIIMENLGGDEPFGGTIPGNFDFTETDRIMAFDVNQPRDWSVPDAFNGASFATGYTGVTKNATRTRKVALFEGTDEFGRLQPLLGTAEPATDYAGNAINWPNEPVYSNNGLVGQMEGSIAWHSPTTENPALGSTEIWEIYNATGDAHPVHLHLVHFEVIDRREFTANVIDQKLVQHNGELGDGFRLENIQVGNLVQQPAGYVENAPKDMVTALPGQVTRIKATFDKPGRYVWHCHILSHEDHEMMRVLHVGPGA